MDDMSEKRREERRGERRGEETGEREYRVCVCVCEGERAGDCIWTYQQQTKQDRTNRDLKRD